MQIIGDARASRGGTDQRCRVPAAAQPKGIVKAPLKRACTVVSGVASHVTAIDTRKMLPMRRFGADGRHQQTVLVVSVCRLQLDVSKVLILRHLGGFLLGEFEPGQEGAGQCRRSRPFQVVRITAWPALKGRLLKRCIWLIAARRRRMVVGAWLSAWLAR